MKKLIATLLAGLMVASLAACGAKQAPAAEAPAAQEEGSASEAGETADAFNPAENPLGFVAVLKSHPVVQTYIAGFMSEAEKLGYPAEVFSGETVDPLEQAKYCDTAVNKGSKGLIIYWLDESSNSLIKGAADKGIPVVSAHTKIDDPNSVPGLKAWIACDPALYGADAARLIGGKIGGKGKVAVTQGSFTSAVENAAVEGFRNCMAEEYPDIQVLDAEEESYEQAAAIAKVESILQANQDLSAGFSVTGSGAAVWAKATENTGRSEVQIVGLDYIRQNLDLIRDGKILGVVAQPLYEEHVMAVQLLDKLLRGEEVPFDNVIPAPVVTAENVDEYYALLDSVEAGSVN